ncbi:MAG TPA: hypothetical protein VFY30_12190 [Solirubrobacterales bacterium]|nr:hypothetical protein [Solirubrobacterales bacterium]
MSPQKPSPAPLESKEWEGPYIRYDLVKEFVVALAVIVALVVVLAVLFSSPDDKPVTIQQWARTDPGDFVATAVTELDGSSEVATYGAPYNHTPDTGQKIGPLNLQSAAGVHIPINTSEDFVLNPLSSIPGDAALTRALQEYQAAPPAQQKAWTDAYTKALDGATFPSGIPQVPPGDYGPVAPMMASLAGLAATGGLDGALLNANQFYQTNYTKPLLFLSGGGYFESRAEDQHLLGTQWGMMNETGSYPGQVWLWLYTFWYQVAPFNTSENADAEIWALMMLLSLAFICIPVIPGVRRLPRHLGVHRLIWRDHYRRVEGRK